MNAFFAETSAMSVRTGMRQSSYWNMCCRLGSLVLSCFAILGFTVSEAAAQKTSCANRTNVLGTSRVIEIDTKGGILLGNQQYKSVDFLEPGEIVLTFDDGPLRRNTARVLNALEAHCAKATFFMVGRMAIADPAMVREIDRRGHTIGTHTWSHKNQGRLSQKGAEREIELGISAVSAVLGKPVAPFFRFPYLSDPRRMLNYVKDRNLGAFSIDGDAFDYKTKSGAAVERQILRTLKRRGKGILLFHDIQTSTARGIMSLLGKLRDRGYKLVHIVPKDPTRTIANYDAAAEKRLKRRRKAKSDVYPALPKGIIVWPVAAPLALPVDPLVNKGPVVARRQQDKDLPWLESEQPAEKKAKKKRVYRKKVYRKKARRKVNRRPSTSSSSWTGNGFFD